MRVGGTRPCSAASPRPAPPRSLLWPRPAGRPATAHCHRTPVLCVPSGRCAVRRQEPRAARPPTCITAVMPPPPPARVHLSRRNFWPEPSISSTAAQIEFWALRIILWNRARMLQQRRRRRAGRGGSGTHAAGRGQHPTTAAPSGGRSALSALRCPAAVSLSALRLLPHSAACAPVRVINAGAQQLQLVVGEHAVLHLLQRLRLQAGKPALQLSPKPRPEPGLSAARPLHHPQHYARAPSRPHRRASSPARRPSSSRAPWRGPACAKAGGLGPVVKGWARLGHGGRPPAPPPQTHRHLLGGIHPAELPAGDIGLGEGLHAAGGHRHLGVLGLQLGHGGWAGGAASSNQVWAASGGEGLSIPGCIAQLR